MEKDVSPSHKRYMQGVLLSKIAPGVHRVLTDTSDLYRSKSVSGLPLKSELTNLIEKTLQEVEAGNSEERTKREVEDCQVELNKKGDDDKEEDKDGDYSQEEYGTRIDMAEQLKDLSAFVEIDLRDEAEEAPKQLAVLLSNLDKAEEEKDKNRIAMKRSNGIPSTTGFSSFSLPLAYRGLFCPSTVAQTMLSGRYVTKEAGLIPKKEAFRIAGRAQIAHSNSSKHSEISGFQSVVFVEHYGRNQLHFYKAKTMRSSCGTLALVYTRS
ncbi:hypothetical protein UY3_10796 [Chelonia mydas]|uniref:Uncharacterized protein n=1 Tax=Chelonia mydas TaxID=8469 RepID=M7B2G0_CHEMY|nr:hypothetical protein UY3_10796 [Chelonia mydas]